MEEKGELLSGILGFQGKVQPSEGVKDMWGYLGCQGVWEKGGPVFPETVFIFLVLWVRNFPTTPDLTEGVSATEISEPSPLQARAGLCTLEQPQTA